MQPEEILASRPIVPAPSRLCCPGESPDLRVAIQSLAAAFAGNYPPLAHNGFVDSPPLRALALLRNVGDATGLKCTPSARFVPYPPTPENPGFCPGSFMKVIYTQ